MEAEGIIALELGLVELEALAVQNRILALCGLPTRVKKLPIAKEKAAMKLDKKGVGGNLRFVLPEALGRVRWPVEVPPDLVDSALRTVIS